MIRVGHVAQPSSGSTLDAVAALLGASTPESLDVAAAYVTSKGVLDLLNTIEGANVAQWADVQKRWLTSFDYCRTEPVALDALLSIPSSAIRVHDASFCLASRGIPRVPFHPKAFFVQNADSDAVLTGSGNLSRSGLARGIEAGLTIKIPRSGTTEATSSTAITALRQWFESYWNLATPLDGPLLANYEKVFEAAPNLTSPTPTEDDVASSYTAKGALIYSDLMKLRACRQFWIEAGNITKNRGPNLPGNQLMMKRLSRVFFGFEPLTLNENTLIGSVKIRFAGGAEHTYSLTYSDNKMDKLNLPMPGSEGPTEYDNKLLLFRRVKPGLFELSLGNQTEKTSWMKRSKGIGGAFKMSSGREWGVF